MAQYKNVLLPKSGVKVFYREQVAAPDAPVMLLLHTGFPHPLTSTAT